MPPRKEEEEVDEEEEDKKSVSAKEGGTVFTILLNANPEIAYCQTDSIFISFKYLKKLM